MYMAGQAILELIPEHRTINKPGAQVSVAFKLKTKQNKNNSYMMSKQI